MPKFQLVVYGKGKRLAMMVGKNNAPSTVYWLVGTVVGKGTFSGCAFPPLNRFATGSEKGVCWNGGLPVAFPKRLPNTRSWKIPKAARTEVLPSRNGSHAIPSRGSKLLKLLS